MKLKDLNIGDVVIIEGVPNEVMPDFSRESSDGETYYCFIDTNPFKKYTGWESVEHFSDNIYILTQPEVIPAKNEQH